MSATANAVRPASRLLVVLLLALFVAQCVWFVGTQSFTNDEPEHIVAGLEAWRYGEFQQWSGHPPLGRMLFALPLLHTDWQYRMSDNQVRLVSPGPEVWLYRSRPVGVALGVILLLLLWTTARKLYSETTANFVLLFAVLSPDLIAHFSTANTDGIGCLFIFASVLQWLRCWRNPTWRQLALFGLLSGLLMLSKYNSPPLLLVQLVLLLVLAPGELRLHTSRLQWKRTGAILLLICFVVWAGFLFHVSKVTFADQMVTLHFQGYTKLLQYEMPTLKTPISIYIPACEWFTGFGWRIHEDMSGHRSFFLGSYASNGLAWYFPVAMALKWPVIILLLGVTGVYAVLRRKVAGGRELLLMSLIPAIYLLFAMKAPVNIGVRHVLPLYPFLLLYAGAAIEWVRNGRWKRSMTTVLLSVLLLAQAADIARYAPDYLSYFTVLVKPANTWHLLSDSNTDWGQGLVALRKYQNQHPGEEIHLAYVGEVDPSFYGIRYTALHEADHPMGTVIVSATHLSGQLLKNHEAYRWLLRYPLKTVLNHTLYVFDTSAQPAP